MFPTAIVFLFFSILLIVFGATGTAGVSKEVSGNLLFAFSIVIIVTSLMSWYHDRHIRM